MDLERAESASNDSDFLSPSSPFFSLRRFENWRENFSKYLSYMNTRTKNNTVAILFWLWHFY